MFIVNVPIEPIEERYSADWNRWFDKELEGKRYITIRPPHPLTNKIREGAFLDVIGTTYFKSLQIAEIAFKVNQGEIPRDEKVVFLIHDGWFPVEQLAYMRDMLGCHDWKFVGIFHAGTYDRWDQIAQKGLYTWGEDLENAWFKIYDHIIVASYYHASLLANTRKVYGNQISIIPWKVEVPKDIYLQKKDIVVFPHRSNPEKQFDLMLNLRMREFNPGWGLHTTYDRCKTKRDYYEHLMESKIAISFSLQETFGIAMVEAVLLGCIPLVPDRLSYKEMYPDVFRYKDMKEFKLKLTEFTKTCNTLPAAIALNQLKDKFKRYSIEFFPKIFQVLENV